MTGSPVHYRTSNWLGSWILALISWSLFGFVNAVHAQQVRVDLELVVAVDSSVSVSEQEFALQILGLVDALRDPQVQTAIAAMGDGMAISVMEWSYGALNRTVLPWTHLRSQTDASRLADRVERIRRVGGGRATAIGDAITRATMLLEDNGFEGLHRKIDISGDARSNSGVHPVVARQIALDKGITINGLAILSSDRELGAYFAEFVAGGPGAFVMAVTSTQSVRQAMHRKLVRELQLHFSDSETQTPVILASR